MNPPGPRIACLAVIDLPLAAWRRADPALQRAPLAVSATSALTSRIVACSEEAHALGVRAGMTASQARARAPEVEEGQALDFAIFDLEALTFVLSGVASRLLARLASRHLACGGVTLRLRLDDGGHDLREVGLAAPTREPAPLLAIVRLSVEERPPPAAVVAVTMIGHAARLKVSQLDLFAPAGPAPDRLATTVARLQALCGPDAVGRVAPLDTHRDEAFAILPFAALRIDERRAGSCGPPNIQLTLRRFRPPRAVEVLLGEGAIPRALSGEGLSAQLAIAAGPYRTSGEWWSQGGFHSDAWDVHASDGALYRLARDGAGHWFLEGYYD